MGEKRVGKSGEEGRGRRKASLLADDDLSAEHNYCIYTINPLTTALNKRTFNHHGKIRK